MHLVGFSLENAELDRPIYLQIEIDTALKFHKRLCH